MARFAGATRSRPSLEAKVVDTLGAGDGFIAGFVFARLGGADMGEALAAGSAYAAEVCGYRGAFGHAHPWSDPEGRIASSMPTRGPAT